MVEMEFVTTAQQAAREAGAVLQDWRRRITVRQKSCPSDLVTEADVQAQAVIHQRIGGRFPDHNFLGEESLLTTSGSSAYRWIIDPLDGTTNYVHGLPYYAVSIGLEHAGQQVLGVIYDPTRDEMFTGVRDGGADLNGVRLETSAVMELSAAMVVASFPRGVDAGHPAVHQFLRVLPLAQSLQRTGSAALNLAYVACGRLDAFWSGSLHPWDMAAGVVLVREAGGRVTQMSGAPFELAKMDLLSSNGSGLHAELSGLLGERAEKV